MRDITALGGVTVTTLMTLVAAGFLVLSGKRHAALFVVVSIAGAALLSSGIKLGFERPRPDLVPHGVEVYTASFPSGHATGAAATYLTLGALLARFQSRRRLKVYLLSLAVLLTVLIGLSRLYLGVHWPSDVLAGWTLGASWALLCWLVAGSSSVAAKWRTTPRLDWRLGRHGLVAGGREFEHLLVDAPRRLVRGADYQAMGQQADRVAVRVLHGVDKLIRGIVARWSVLLAAV